MMTRAKIKERAVKVIKGEIAGDIEQMESIVVKTTLQNLNLLKWLKSPHLKYYFNFGKFYPTKNKQMVVAISNGKDEGVLAVYSQILNDYNLVEILSGFTLITGLEVATIAAFSTDLIIVEEKKYPKSFEKLVKTKSILMFNDGEIIKVWERNTYSKKIYPAENFLSSEETEWLMKIENVNFRISAEGKIVVYGTQTYWRSNVVGKINGEYEKIGLKVIEETYKLE